MGILLVLTKGQWPYLPEVGRIDLDLLVIIIAYLFLYYGSAGAGVFAFCLGFITDLFSADLYGLYALSYLSAFGAVSLGSKFLDLQYPKGQVILVLAGVFLKNMVGFLIVFAYLDEPSLSMPNLWTVGLFAGLTALIAPLLFGFFDRLRRARV